MTIDITKVQAGDTIILNKSKYVVDFIEPDKYGFDVQLHTPTGDKVRKCLSIDEVVSIEI
jgi:hypothetical protein